jgi:hypothetical protein
MRLVWSCTKSYMITTVMITWNGGHLEKYGRHFEFHVANGIFRISSP